MIMRNFDASENDPLEVVFLKIEIVSDKEGKVPASKKPISFFPSPSISATAIDCGFTYSPGGYGKELYSNALGINDAPAGIVTRNGTAENPVSPFVLTEMVLYSAPAGTVTVREVGLADVTTDLIVPNDTILFAAVASKPVPVIVTGEPIKPDKGENELITGACPKHANADTQNINARADLLIRQGLPFLNKLKIQY